jgi:hypothetical protein
MAATSFRRTRTSTPVPITKSYKSTWEIVVDLESQPISEEVVAAATIKEIRELQTTLKYRITDSGSEHPSVLDGMNTLAEVSKKKNHAHYT